MLPVSLLVAIVLSVGSLSPHDVHARQTVIKVAGSSTVLPIVARAAEAFSARHPHMRVMVSPGGSGVGVKLVGHHLVHIGMVSRRILDNERAGFPQADFHIHVIGRDAVACVVSSETGEFTLAKSPTGARWVALIAISLPLIKRRTVGLGMCLWNTSLEYRARRRQVST